MILTVLERTWWISIDSDTYDVNFGYILPKMTLNVGNSILESFSEKSNWLMRLNELGIEIEERLR